MTNDIKQTIGETTEQIEAVITPLYTNLEPWQRGALILGLIALLIIVIYWLTKPNPTLINQQANRKLSQKEKEIEERLLRQMAFFKKLKE